jgi:hypothetical protein
VGGAIGVDVVGPLIQRYWTLEIPVGLMIQIHDNLGLTLGAAMRYETTFFDFAAPAVVYFPFGIFGLKAFFN